MRYIFVKNNARKPPLPIHNNTMKQIKNILLALLLMLSGNAIAQDAASKILGTYKVPSPFTDDIAKVKITQSKNGTYSGRIVWVNKPNKEDGTPVTDEKNPDPKLRTRKATEIVMFWNLRYDKEEWVEGILYDPYSGKKFGVKFSLEKNGKDLKARYYKGKPAFGINATWTKES